MALKHRFSDRFLQEVLEQLDLRTEELEVNDVLTSVEAISFGVSALTFTASRNSGNKDVVHGLGTTPVVVVASPLTSPAIDKIPTPNIFSLTGTQFTANARIETAHTGDISFMWVALA